MCGMSKGEMKLHKWDGIEPSRGMSYSSRLHSLIGDGRSWKDPSWHVLIIWSSSLTRPESLRLAPFGCSDFNVGAELC